MQKSQYMRVIVLVPEQPEQITENLENYIKAFAHANGMTYERHIQETIITREGIYDKYEESIELSWEVEYPQKLSSESESKLRLIMEDKRIKELGLASSSQGRRSGYILKGYYIK